MVRVRENRAQRDRAGGLIDGDIRKFQRAGLRILKTVIRHQLHFRFAVFLFQAAIGQLLFQAQEIIARLGDVNIDRIQLLNSCQGSRLTILHQRPFGHRGFTNPAADRRGDFGVGQIDARSFHGRFRCDHGRIALLCRRDGGIVVLLTNIFSA